jgi:hypothetical protein
MDEKRKNQSDKIRTEQHALNAKLKDLVGDGHGGKYILFHDGEVCEFFDTEGEAYAEGMARFGPEEIFVVDRVVNRDPEPLSLSWELGLTFGGQESL